MLAHTGTACKHAFRPCLADWPAAGLVVAGQVPSMYSGLKLPCDKLLGCLLSFMLVPFLTLQLNMQLVGLHSAYTSLELPFDNRPGCLFLPLPLSLALSMAVQ